MTAIRGILFDKDGTLLDFDAMWIPTAIKMTEEVIKELELSNIKNIKEKLLVSIGVENGIVNPLGALAVGTVKDIKLCFSSILVNERVNTNKIEVVGKIMERLSKENVNLIKPIGDLSKLFQSLKQKNILLGLATADTLESAKFCLKQLGIFDYFVFIGGDNGIFQSKPHPDLLKEFCLTCGLEPEEVAVVGDTPIDIEFARNGKAGLAMAVLSGTNKKEDFPEKADIVMNSVEEIIDEEGNFIWSKFL